MTDVFNPFYIFEHPEFVDAFDCQRQSRLYGFDYQGQCHCRAGVWSIDGLKPAR